MSDEELNAEALQLLIKKLTYNIKELQKPLEEIQNRVSAVAENRRSPNYRLGYSSTAKSIDCDRYARMRSMEKEVEDINKRIKKLKAYLKIETELTNHKKLL